jgi:hypothetical protein
LTAMRRTQINLWNEDLWCGGPLLEVYFMLRNRQGAGIDWAEAIPVLDALGVDGPYEGVSQLLRRKARPEKLKARPTCYGVWTLEEHCDIGVKLILPRGDCADLLLGIPPPQANALFPPYSWHGRGWLPSAANVEFHRLAIARARAARAHVPLCAMLIMEEAEGGRLTQEMEGILVRAEVGPGLDAVGTIEGRRLLIPWDATS